VDWVAFLAQYLAAADTFAQVLATLYIAIAIFSGEQVASDFKADGAKIRINARRYMSYLNLLPASLLLMGLVLAGGIGSAHIFAHELSPLTSDLLFAGLQTAVIAAIFWIMYDTLVHRAIEKQFQKITGSVSRLVAWALSKERDENERLKLVAALLERDNNDTDLERLMLKTLEDCLTRLIAAPGKHRGADVLNVLRTLKANIAYRPLSDPSYYEKLFIFAHGQWAAASRRRTELHSNGFYQMSSTLGGVCRKIEQVSLGSGELGYDFFTQLRAFLKANEACRLDYFRYVGNEILEHVATSPEESFMWGDKDYVAEWRVAYDKPLAQQSYGVQALYQQYLSLVRKSQRDYAEDSIDEVTDRATDGLFLSIDPRLWGDLVALWDACHFFANTGGAIDYWRSHPRRFAFSALVPVSDDSKRADGRKQRFAELEEHTIELAANTGLFSVEQLERLIQGFKALQDTNERQQSALRVLAILKELLGKLQATNKP
jgi:hypothetical protein